MKKQLDDNLRRQNTKKGFIIFSIIALFISILLLCFSGYLMYLMINNPSSSDLSSFIKALASIQYVFIVDALIFVSFSIMITIQIIKILGNNQKRITKIILFMYLFVLLAYIVSNTIFFIKL